MIVFGSSNNPAQARHRIAPKALKPSGSGQWITGYMGRELRDPSKPVSESERPSRDQIYPMATLIEQDADSVLSAHFHISDQFQIFMAGDGNLGNKPIKDVVVQFAGTHTVYGPIGAGAHGIHYLTLRNRFDPGARTMPESRDELPPPPRFNRQVIGDPIHSLTAAELAALKTPMQMQLLAPEPDGLGAWHYRLPPGAAVQGPDPGTGEGQHWAVLGGSLDYRNELAGRHTCIFVSTDEPAFSAKAGPHGLEILALQYPFRSKARS